MHMAENSKTWSVIVEGFDTRAGLPIMYRTIIQAADMYGVWNKLKERTESITFSFLQIREVKPYE